MEFTLKSSKKIVSVVDDDIDISKLFQIALSENMEGITVFSFNDPILALEHFNENKSAYVLVISDLRMSGLNGLELLKRIKDSNSSVRTILMSGYNFDEVKAFQEYMEQGIIDSTIEKPVTIQRLSQRARDELDIYQIANS
jgi:DNA-binding NtrC family response regulator